MATTVSGESNSSPMNGTDNDQPHAEANHPTSIFPLQDYQASTQQQQQQFGKIHSSPELGAMSYAYMVQPNSESSFVVPMNASTGGYSLRAMSLPAHLAPNYSPNLHLQGQPPPYPQPVVLIVSDPASTPVHQLQYYIPQPSTNSQPLPNLNLNMNQPPFASGSVQIQVEPTIASAVNNNMEQEAADHDRDHHIHQAEPCLDQEKTHPTQAPHEEATLPKPTELAPPSNPTFAPVAEVPPASASESKSKRARPSLGLTKNAGNLANLLPTGTVLIFQALTPSLSNNGKCDILNKWLVGFTIGCCAIACFLSSFTDTLEVEIDYSSQKKMYYGFVTRQGLSVLNTDGEEEKFKEWLTHERYKVCKKDCVHAIASLIVFLIFAVSSTEVVDCFFPGAGEKQYSVIIYMPLVAGILSTCFFTLCPTTRRGIGYAAANVATDLPAPRAKF